MTAILKRPAPVRAALLFAAGFLTLFGAAGYALVLLPDLHGDLVEIGVRPSVLGSTVLHLYFAGMAMFAFALMVCAAAVQAMRGGVPSRFPLALVAAVQIVFGTMEFSRSHNPHHLGPIVMGILIVAALLVPAAAGSPVDGG